MIKIERTDPPEYLKGEKVIKETEDAKKIFDPAKSETPALIKKRKEFSYKKYRNEKVKNELIKMCNQKCAYCESTFLHVYYGDIEHFRPKKFVGTKKEPMIPGYYWLANDWENLLLSCLFCNQAKSHKVEKSGDLVKVTIGKQNQFPLSNKTLYKQERAHQKWDDIKDKDEKARLLLDPCKDDPEDHLMYTKDGVITPKKIKKGTEVIDDPKGTTSIEVYALQRIYLVQERRKQLIKLQLQFDRIKEFVKRLEDKTNVPNPVLAAYYRNRIKKEINDLFYFTHKKEAYSAMSRQFVYEFLNKKLNKKLTVIRKAEKAFHDILDEPN